jgi:hypothetical protein
MAEAQQSTDHSAYRCQIIDAFKLEGGRIRRDAETESWRELVDPIQVIIKSGIIQLGPDGIPVQWEIMQSAEPGWDFVAEKSESGNTVLSTLRMRLWESTVQVVLTINGFTFATGTCELFREESREAQSHQAVNEALRTALSSSTP